MDFDSGYPIELFLTPPKDLFNCSICLMTAKDPMRCEDEHIFCNKCIRTWIAKGKHSCPIDRKYLNSRNLSIFRLAEEMLGEYCVRCVTALPQDDLVTKKRKRTRAEKAKILIAKRKKRVRKQPKFEELCASNCGWTGKLCDLSSHYNTCPESSTKCTWVDCDLVLLRKNVPAHAAVCRHRLEPCERCGKLRKPSKRNIHKQRCPMIGIQCPNVGCDEIIMRSEQSQHRSVCPYQLVPCLHRERLGCRFIALRKDITAHSEDKLLHFDATIRAIDRYRAQSQNAYILLSEREKTIRRLENANRELMGENNSEW